MIKFKDEHFVSHFLELALSNSSSTGHVPSQVQVGLHVKCCVCALENKIQEMLKKSARERKQLEEAMGIP